CLAVINMAHDRDDRSPGFEGLGEILFAAKPDFDIGLGNAPQAVPKLPNDEFGRVGVERLIDRCQNAHAHQGLDYFGAALGHAVSQLLDSNRLGYNDLAPNLDLLLFTLMQPLAFAFPGPPDRGQTAHPRSFVVSERARDRDLPGPAAHLFSTRQWHRLFCLWARPATRSSGGLFFLFLQRNAAFAGDGERFAFRGGGL